MTRPIVFISYSHKDEKEKDALVTHLGVLANAGYIDIWVDDQLGAGDDWKAEIDRAMAQAKVAILLISANSLTSDFILSEEVPALLKRREREGLTIFPMIAKSCTWQSVDWLAEMNVRPKNGAPVWREAGRYADEDLAAIAKEVDQIVKTTKPVTHNPFIYYDPVDPEHFIGRSQAIEHILNQLRPTIRGSSAISGDPGVGKTSLLYYLCSLQVYDAWKLPTNIYHFLFLDCHSIIPCGEATFWRSVLRELRPHLADDEALSGRVKHLLEQATPDNFEIQDLFDSIASAERLVVLMLDEFEGVLDQLDPTSPILLHQLRALLNRSKRGLALLVATRKPLNELCAGFHFFGSPFHNSFKAVTLTPFSQAEIDELLHQYRVAFSPTERALLHQLARGYPYLVQLAGSLIIGVRASDASPESYISQIEAKLEQETEEHFSDLLRYFGERQKMLLAWLALKQLSQLLPDNRIDLGNFKTLFDYFPREMGRLIKRGFVLDQPEGPELFSPVFGSWVLRQVIIARGHEVLSPWVSDFENALTLSQQETLKELIDEIIRRPAIVKNPELLAKFYTQTSTGRALISTTGQRLGNYIIEEIIGEGGMANVYKARHLDLNRLAAIKRLRGTLADDEKSQTRFRQEAQAVAALEHPHIVQIYDFGFQDNHYYMVMAFIEGTNLRKHLNKLQTSEQRLSWVEGLRIASHVAEALDYAHQKQMVHQDIKPANILLRHDDSVFLTDFGMVRLLDQTGITQSGGFGGTSIYMSPEQIMEETDCIDHRVDIYALGCVVYEMITGQLPFEPNLSPLAYIDAIPLAPDSIIPDLPKAASQIILKALAKKPDERPSSAGQFINDLRQALDF